jgi:hypothetical protein
MSPSEYQNHPLHALLDRVAKVLSSEELTRADVTANEKSLSAIQAVQAIVSALNMLMSRTPPLLVSGHGLAQIQNGIQAVFNELTAFQSNNNSGHLQNAKSQVEQVVMPNVWAFGPIGIDTELGPLSDVVAQITKSATQSIQNLTQQRDKVAARNAALNKQLTEAESRLASLTETVSKQKAEASSVVATVQKQYAEKETERIASFESLLKQMRTSFDQLQAEANTSQAAHLASLQSSQDQAAKIVQVVGNIGVTGNYQKIANDEGRQADLWRKVTVAFFCTGIAVAAATFWKFWDQPFTPENAWSVLIRLMYALAITAPAWYTARESARHRTNADRARQTELELASLGPFIELLPAERKSQIREDLTKRYFGNSVPDHTVEEPVNLKEVRDFAVEIVKAAKR